MRVYYKRVWLISFVLKRISVCGCLRSADGGGFHMTLNLI